MNHLNDRQFPSLDEGQAPAAARDTLELTRRRWGRLPEPLKRYASSPLMLRAALTQLEWFETSSLNSVEREVLAMTMARVNECRFCLDLHLRMLAAQNVSPELVRALEQGLPLHDARLEALRAFVVSALEQRGNVAPEAWRAFRVAGYGHEQALELLLGISAYTLTTFANRLTQCSE